MSGTKRISTACSRSIVRISRMRASARSGSAIHTWSMPPAATSVRRRAASACTGRPAIASPARAGSSS